MKERYEKTNFDNNDMSGNVMEWCSDGYGDTVPPFRRILQVPHQASLVFSVAVARAIPLGVAEYLTVTATPPILAVPIWDYVSYFANKTAAICIS